MANMANRRVKTLLEKEKNSWNGFDMSKVALLDGRTASGQNNSSLMPRSTSEEIKTFWEAQKQMDKPQYAGVIYEQEGEELKRAWGVKGLLSDWRCLAQIEKLLELCDPFTNKKLYVRVLETCEDINIESEEERDHYLIRIVPLTEDEVQNAQTIGNRFLFVPVRERHIPRIKETK
jgi:hypothetical protein